MILISEFIGGVYRVGSKSFKSQKMYYSSNEK